MGQACSKQFEDFYHKLCSEEQTDKGEKYIIEHGTQYGNDQLPEQVEHGFGWSVILVSFFHLIVAVGILIFGIYTYCLRVEIDNNNHRLSSDGVIYQLALVPNYLIGIGCIVIAFSLLGIAGILRHYLPLMYLYIAFLLLYTVCQLICAVLALTISQRIDSAIRNYVSTTAIVNYREDIDLQNLIDFIQVEFECCGGSDDTGYLDWAKNPYFTCSLSNPNFERCAVPFSCCKDTKSIFTDLVNAFCGFNAQRMDPILANSTNAPVFTGGCVSAVYHSLSTYGGYIVVAILGLILVPIVLEILLVFLIRDVRKERLGYDLWVAEQRRQGRDIATTEGNNIEEQTEDESHV